MDCGGAHRALLSQSRGLPRQMFAGSHQLTIDDKGRLAVPARFRQQLSEQSGLQLVITKGPDQCLEIYPLPDFRRITDQIDQMEDREAAELLKFAFVGLAVETEVDRQGRVSLPPMLRRQAQLESSVVLVGQINRFDLWSESLWNDKFNAIQPSLKDAFRTLKR